jgi:hypothetical protein
MSGRLREPCAGALELDDPVPGPASQLCPHRAALARHRERSPHRSKTAAPPERAQLRVRQMVYSRALSRGATKGAVEIYWIGRASWSPLFVWAEAVGKCRWPSHLGDHGLPLLLAFC